MSIDKQKLQSLLWSEVAAWKAGCAEWKRNTEALQEFLGEKTVEEVALELLAENERLTKRLGEMIDGLPSKVVHP
jgi:regulator of replication initiation timing